MSTSFPCTYLVHLQINYMKIEWQNIFEYFIKREWIFSFNPELFFFLFVIFMFFSSLYIYMFWIVIHFFFAIYRLCRYIRCRLSMTVQVWIHTNKNITNKNTHKKHYQYLTILFHQLTLVFSKSIFSERHNYVMKRRWWARGTPFVALTQEIIRVSQQVAINDPLGTINSSNLSLSVSLRQCSVRNL